MGDLKISSLPRKSALATNDLIPIVDLQFGAPNYVNKKTTIGDLVTIISNSVAEIIGSVSSVNGQTGAVVINVSTLDDVVVQTPLDGDILQYDEATGKWINVTLNTAYAPIVDGKVPSDYLPSYVDDVVEYFTVLLFPDTGESGKIYVDITTGYTYRWSGTMYVEIGNLDHAVSWTAITDLPTVFPPEQHASDHLIDGIDPFPAASIAQAQIASAFGNADIAGDITETRELSQNASNLIEGTVSDSLISSNIARTADLTSSNVTTAEFTVKAVTQGVYSDGSTVVAGTALETVIKNMLQAVIPATYTQPTLSLAALPSTAIYEYGASVSIALTLSWTQNDAGDATQFRLLKNGVVVYSVNSATSGASHSESLTITSAITFSAAADYSAGAQKTDNMGNPSGTPIASGTKTSNTLTLTPRHKRYWGVSSSTSLNSAGVLALAASELSTSKAQSRVFNTNNQYVYFAWPVSFGEPAFTVNGLPNSAWIKTNISSFTNASGYTESYDIYRSQYLSTGTGISIQVT